MRTGFVDDAMIDAILPHLPAALQPVVQFAYITGWRVQSEILPIEWRHVDRKTGEVRLDPGTTKNQAGRVFPFTDTIKTLMDDLWAENEVLKKAGTICPFVFHRNGKRIKSLRRYWEDACTAAGHPGKLLHDLRRSAVRNMVPDSRDQSRCNSLGTRQRLSTAATPLQVRLTYEKVLCG